MKSIKMFGLAALAALMAMAFVGASSAMATNTQLCKAEESTCAAGNVITHVHEQTQTGAQATLLSSLGNVTCTTTLYLGDSLGLGAPLVIHGHFTYSGCTREGESCTVSETSTDALINVLKTAAETAEVTGSAKVNVFCNAFINCTYNGTGLKGTAKGPLLASPNGEVSLSEQTVTKESGLCPKTGKLDIVTKPLEAVYISS